MIGQTTVRQLIVVDGVGIDGPSVFAGERARDDGLRLRVGQRVGHFHAHVALVAERDRESGGFLLDLRGDENGVCCSGLGALKLIAALFRVQSRAVDGGGDNLRVICILAFEAEFIKQLAALQLIVLDGQIDALVRAAENRPGRDGFFVPGELELQIQTVFVGNHKCIAERLAGDAGCNGDIVGLGVLAVRGGHLERAGLRQASACAIRRIVIRADEFRLAGALSEKIEAVLEEPVRQGVAFDSACDRAVCVARRLPVRLPAETEIQIDAGFEAENEGELNIRFDGLALLVFLRGVGLHGEDVVLVFRAVR